MELERQLGEWRGRLFSVAYAELPGRYEDAQDAVAAALVRIVRKRESLREPDRFGAWACQIARREARRIAARSSQESIHDELVARETDSVLRLDIAAALHRLPADLARTLTLYYQQGLGIAEISSLLETPEGTIKWRLSRGRERLRHELKGYEPMNRSTCLLSAPTLDAPLRERVIELLHHEGWTDVQIATAFAEVAATTADAVVLTEMVGTHSAFELIPLLRQQPERRIWLLLDPGRTPEEQRLTATAAYIAGVDLLLTRPFTLPDFQHFARRLHD